MEKFYRATVAIKNRLMGSDGCAFTNIAVGRPLDNVIGECLQAMPARNSVAGAMALRSILECGAFEVYGDGEEVIISGFYMPSTRDVMDNIPSTMRRWKKGQPLRIFCYEEGADKDPDQLLIAVHPGGCIGHIDILKKGEDYTY